MTARPRPRRATSPRRPRHAVAPGPPIRLRPSYPIRTQHLALRPYTSADLDAVHDVQAREDVVRYLMWGPMGQAAAIELLERRRRQVEIDGDDSTVILAATIPPDDRPIGEFMLRVTSAAHRQGEIGWLLHPDVQGRGYATEGAREMLRIGFEELGLHRIVADADPRNVASLRVMERLGMRPEAVHRDSLFVKGEWVGAAVYAMLEDEWRSDGPDRE